jgi:capsular exopolysaccharide synthesis family protein
MENTKGITDLLIGSVKKEDVILDSQILDNWNVMTSGYIPPNPTEILGSDQMKNLIDELRAEYEIIIVDLPPVNIVSDALVVSPYLDGMVVVVRENYSDIRSLDACINQLGLAGVKLLGLIMTVSENSGVGYGKYRYKYK